MDWISHFPVEPLAIAAACSVIFAGSIMQAATGMAAGLIMAPILILIDPVFVPGPVLLSSMSLNLLMMRREWGDLRRDGLATVIIGLLIGAILGGLVMGALSDGPIRILSGVLVLVAVAVSFLGFRPPQTRGNNFLAGVISAFMGTIAAVGGALLALYYQYHPGPVVRSTLALLYLVACAFMIIALVFAGRFGLDEILASLVLLPGWMLGYQFAKRIARFLDGGYTRVAILLIAGSSSVVLIIRNL